MRNQIIIDIKNKKITLRLILLVAFILQAVLMTTLITLFSYSNSQKAVNELIQKLKNETSSKIYQYVVDYLDAPVILNKLNAHMIHQSPGIVNDQDLLISRFLEQVKTHPHINSIYFGNNKGGLANSGREAVGDSLYIIRTDNFKAGNFNKYAVSVDGRIENFIVSVPNFDATHRAWFQNAVTYGTHYWSDVYTLFTGQDIAISASYPVYTEDYHLLGVVSCDLFLSHLSHYLSRINISQNGMSFILDKQGRMIASSLKEKLFEKDPDTGVSRQINGLDSSSDIIRKSVQTLIHQNETLDFEKTGNYTFKHKNQIYHLQATPIVHNLNLNWIIVTIIPENDFMGQIKRSNLITYSMIAIFLILSIFLAFFITKRILKPISDLKDNVIRLTHTNWDIEIPEYRISEIDLLGKEFSMMSQSLKQAFEKIEQETTEKLKTQLELKGKETQIGIIGDNLPKGLIYRIIRDKTGHNRFTYISNGVRELHQLTPEQVLNDACLLYSQIHPDDLDYVLKKEIESLNKLELFEVECRFIKPDGNESWRRLISVPYLSEEGEYIGDGIELDITDQKIYEQAIESEKERLSVTLKSIADGVITTDTNGHIFIMNRIAEELTGWMSHEAFQKPLDLVYNVVNDKTLEPADNLMGKVVKTGLVEERTSQIHLISKSGKSVMISESYAPIKDKQENIIGVIIVFRDITEKQKMIEAMNNAQKLESIGLLAGGIAHDFNNLLSGIYGNLELALLESNELSVQEFLGNATKSLDRARALTNQLLTFSKGGVPVKKFCKVEPFMMETVNFALSGSNVSCQFEIEDQLMTAYFDKNQMAQVVDNIVINAQQAMPLGGEIKVKVSNFDNALHKNPLLKSIVYIRIDIRDAGIGIARENIPYIFDPFFTTKSKGHGLGLATCYSIIKQHDGLIECDSELGKGTIFSIYLPAIKGNEAQNADKNEIIKGKGVILVMDDEETVRTFLKNTLIYLGYEVICTENGDKTLEIYKQSKKIDLTINCMIFDLTIPGGKGGKETISELRQLDQEIPVIVSSGYSKDPILSDPKAYGFNAAISKPYKIKELSMILNQLIQFKK